AGGLGVYVQGAKGFVYNAHLSRLGKMGQVKTGDIIGYVGQSGNARYTAPHDHFEWHPGGGSAIDPFPFLNQVC
ncbi:MAG TPA: M23 family peptidase, partial [Actinomycetota bacterium]